MRRITDREVTGDGEGRHVRRMRQDGALSRLEIERLLFVAERAVAAADELDRIGPDGTPKTGALQLARLVAEQQQADGTSLPLDDRIGGQRGGKRHQRY